MKKSILLSLAIMLASSVLAQSKMNAISKLTLETKRTEAVSKAKGTVATSNAGKDAVRAFITVSDKATLATLRQKGVELGYSNGHVATATIPMSVIDDVLAMDDVTDVRLSRTLKLHNDLSRKWCFVDALHEGEGLERTYKGKGVIYGTVDGGIDFNHATFKDEDGKSRILLAYLPDAESKQDGAMENYPVTIGEYSATLKGYVYDTDHLSELTTGRTSVFHGTHTATTGAGNAYGSKDYYGMAPEASLILVDVEWLEDPTIVDGVALVFSEAEKRGMPAVVNLSLGGNTGPHIMEGYTELLNSMTGPGRIICLSAGNEGDTRLWLNKPAGESVKTLVVPTFSNDNNAPDGFVDIWGKDNKPFTLKFYARNTGTNELHELYDSDKEGEKIVDSSPYIKSGKIEIEMAHKHDNYNVAFFCDSLNMHLDYELVMELSGEAEADAWGEGGKISFCGEKGTDYAYGSPDCSLNTLTCFDNAISVGSYNSTNKFVWAGNGKTYGFSEDLYPKGKVSYFSSYGIDREGRVCPTVIAPGAVISSAGSIYCERSKLTDSPNDLVVGYDEKDGRIQPYVADIGTSMAAPAVSGIIALWLEQNPTLTPKDVKNIMALTCTKDELLAGDENRIGYGRINALSGMLEVPSGIIQKVMGSEPIIMPSQHGFSVLSPKSGAKVEVFNAAGQCVMNATATGGVTQSFSISESGMYIVKVGATVKKVTL